MKDPGQVMLPATAVLFERLRHEALLQPFTLIGGTALSLHIGHRISEDLDFITTQDELPRAALNRLWQVLENEGHQLIAEDNPAAYDDFLNAGLDLHDFSQNWLVDTKVKITFFTADNHHRSIIKNSGGAQSFAIGSLSEIAQLKALVAASRSKSRDWLDLFILERDHQFGLNEWKDAFDQAGLHQSHFENALNRITSGRLTDKDEGYQTLMPNPPSVAEICQRFQTLRDAYEVAAAHKTLNR